MRALILTALATLMVAGCAGSRGDSGLMNIGSSRSPDEFAILPTQPLQAPPDYSSLPQPSPGGRNLVDPDPRADAVSALGGNVAAERGAGVPASDEALVRHAARHGVQEDIRETLSAEDARYRQRNRGRVLERLFNVNTYQRTYEGQALDRHAELERWRRAGARTPAAPPRR